MPIGQFEPIIGSSFDAIASQRQNMLGLDAQIQNQNLARASQAEREQQNWLAQVADMRNQAEQADVTRQLNADSQAHADALQAHNEAIRRGERAEDITRASKQFEAQMKFGADQITSQQKIAEDKIKATTKNEDLRTEAHGQTLAANYGVAKKNADLADAALKGLQAAQDQDEAELEKTDVKKDALKYNNLKNRITSRKQDLRNAETAARHTSNALDKLELSATNGGFDIREDGDIIHADSGKKWTWKNALRGAQENTTPLGPPAPTADTAAPQGVPWGQLASTFGQAAMIGASPLASPALATPPWAGFTRGTGTTPAPVQQPQSPFPEGTVIRSKKDGNLYRVVNGAPVMIPPEDQP